MNKMYISFEKNNFFRRNQTKFMHRTPPVATHGRWQSHWSFLKGKTISQPPWPHTQMKALIKRFHNPNWPWHDHTLLRRKQHQHIEQQMNSRGPARYFIEKIIGNSNLQSPTLESENSSRKVIHKIHIFERFTWNEFLWKNKKNKF